MPVAFDTLKAAQRLREEAGFSEQQAAVLVTTLAEGVGENLATKADIEAGFAAMQAAMQASDERTEAAIAAIRAEMQASEERTQLAMQASDERMEAAIAAVQAAMRASDERTQAEFRAVRAEMREQEQSLKLYLGRLVVGGVGVLLASIGIVAAIILTAG